MTPRPNDLPIPTSLAFHVRFWTVQRLAWAAFGGVLVIALMGLTGAGGPLSQTVTRWPGGEVEAPRVGRWSTSDEIRVTLAPGEAERTLSLSHAFARAYQLEDIQPLPIRSLAGEDGAVLAFAAEPGRPARITLHARALQPGLAHYTLGVDGAEVSVRTLVLP